MEKCFNKSIGMSYEEAMSYIAETAKFGSNYGLLRTEKVLEFLGNPHKKLKCIHIAGTNGKGSTTSMLTSILMEAGYKVGMYTSPFLEEFEERIQINKTNIPKEDLAEFVTRVKEAVDKVIEMGFDNPTEFEIITCVMLLYFYEQKVDYAVIEVGLGGRLDSTNVITPILSIITSISFDHVNILGDTLEKITYEKAGIIKEGVPVVCYPQQEESIDVIKKVAGEKKSLLTIVKSNAGNLINPKGESFTQVIKINTDKDSYLINLPLLGKHQVLNCAVAVTAVEKLIELGLSISKKQIVSGLGKVTWNGRMEVLRTSPLVVIDGAHNIDGISKVRESVEMYFDFKKIILILGILGDKEVEKMVSEITSITDRVIVTSPHSYRAEAPEKIKGLIKEHEIPCEIIEDYREAYLKAIDICNDGDMILICGSLYMVGDMRKEIKALL